MLWSGSDPRAVMRDSMWAFLMFAGVAWLAIGWSVLRLEPSDVAGVAGPMILFGALCEGVRALAGTRTWWLNAGMGGLFAVTGLIVLVAGDSTFATPAALVGWYLMVRGAMDVSVSTMNRGTDRTWGLLLALGVAQAGLGYFAAGPLTRTAESVVLVLGAVGVLRGVADLVTALRLREVSGGRHDVLQLSPEREAGVAGYSAGLTDFEEQPKPDYEPHQEPRSLGDQPHAEGNQRPAYEGQQQHLAHEPGYPAEAGPGFATEAGPGFAAEAGPGFAAESPAHQQSPYQQSAYPQSVYQPQLRPAYEARPQHGPESQVEGADRARHRAEGPAGRAFHDEVVRSTRDLDSTIAQAGVTGTGAPAHRIPDDLPPAPATVEGAAEAADYRR